MAACGRWAAAQGSRLSQSAWRRKKKGIGRISPCSRSPGPTTHNGKAPRYGIQLHLDDLGALATAGCRHYVHTANEKGVPHREAHNRALPPNAETILAGEIARYSPEPAFQGLGARPGQPGPHLSKRTKRLGKCGRWPLARGPPPRETPTHPPMHGQPLAKRCRLPPPPPPLLDPRGSPTCRSKL